VTVATLLAAAAGALAAAGAVELGGTLAARPARGGLRRAVLAALARAGRGLRASAPRDLEDRIAAAGLTTPAADVMAVKAGAAATMLVAALPLLSTAPGRVGVAATAAAPGVGFLAPDAWLRRRARKRARAVDTELGDVLDLLRVAIGAGLTPRRALAEVGRRHRGILAAELRRAADAMALGRDSRTALMELERRCPAAGIAPLTAALRRADRHGAPLGPALAAQAADARARVAQRASEAAARAAPQIQLVVALLLVPSVMLLVAAALGPALTGAL
jgi:tight adherence protein C